MHRPCGLGPDLGRLLPLTATPGDLVGGRYALLEPLGRGGTATAWAARDERTGEGCVVKLLPPGALSVHRQERVALRLLDHPGVVRLRDEGVDADAAWLVLDRVEGEPFPGSLSLSEAVLSLVGVLSELHEAGIVHGDLKPDHVRVVDGQVVLLDFGYARWSSVGPIGYSARWAAPELLVGRDPTAASDVYSVGALVLELSGCWAGRSTTELVEARILRPGAGRFSLEPPALELCATACLARDPGRRPSATGLVRQLAPPTPQAPPGGWTRDALRELVAGPERVLHLPTDGGDLLWRRTTGDVSRVRAEALRWMAAGARLRGDRLHVRRSVLERLLAVDASPRALADEARALDLQGRSAEAVRRLCAGLRVVDAPVDALLAALVRVAVRSEARPLLARALGEVERWCRRDRLGQWLQIALDLVDGRLAEASSALFAAVGEDDLRAVLAAQLIARGVEEAPLRELAALAPGALRNARGLAAYRQGRFADAVQDLTAAADVACRVTVRLSALCNASAAALELGEHGRAEALAEVAAAEAASARSPRFELRSLALGHAARYRGGRSSGPDPELLDLARRLGEPALEGWCALVDAATAWRAGDGATASRWAARARRAYRGCGAIEAAELAAGLEAATEERRDLERIAWAVRSTVPGVALQVAALSGACADEVPMEAWLSAIGAPLQGRREVLSPRECVARLSRVETAAR